MIKLGLISGTYSSCLLPGSKKTHFQRPSQLHFWHFLPDLWQFLLR